MRVAVSRFFMPAGMGLAALTLGAAALPPVIADRRAVGSQPVRQGRGGREVCVPPAVSLPSGSIGGPSARASSFPRPPRTQSSITPAPAAVSAIRRSTCSLPGRCASRPKASPTVSRSITCCTPAGSAIVRVGAFLLIKAPFNRTGLGHASCRCLARFPPYRALVRSNTRPASAGPSFAPAAA